MQTTDTITVNDKPKRAINWRRVWLMLAIIIAHMAAIAGLVYAFFYYGYQRVSVERGLGMISPRGGAPYIAEEIPKFAPSAGDAGTFTFEGKFEESAPTDEAYGDLRIHRDAGCEIMLSTYRFAAGNAYVADIYIDDIARLQTGMANDQYGKGQREDPLAIADRSDAIIAITGDNYSERFGGAIMRNGALYSDSPIGDSCVLYWDGTVEIISEEDFDITDIMAKKPYQIWSCGPVLVTAGRAPDYYSADMFEPMRRTAFCYFEPGHYAFIAFDADVSYEALTQSALNLGCESAYAMYPASIAAMTYDGESITQYGEANRECSDILLIQK
jgi:hypothetical protein